MTTRNPVEKSLIKAANSFDEIDKALTCDPKLDRRQVLPFLLGAGATLLFTLPPEDAQGQSTADPHGHLRWENWYLSQHGLTLQDLRGGIHSSRLQKGIEIQYGGKAFGKYALVTYRINKVKNSALYQSQLMIFGDVDYATLGLKGKININFTSFFQKETAGGAAKFIPVAEYRSNHSDLRQSRSKKYQRKVTDDAVAIYDRQKGLARLRRIGTAHYMSTYGTSFNGEPSIWSLFAQGVLGIGDLAPNGSAKKSVKVIVNLNSGLRTAIVSVDKKKYKSELNASKITFKMKDKSLGKFLIRYNSKSKELAFKMFKMPKKEELDLIHFVIK